MLGRVLLNRTKRSISRKPIFNHMGQKENAGGKARPSEPEFRSQLSHLPALIIIKYLKFSLLPQSWKRNSAQNCEDQRREQAGNYSPKGCAHMRITALSRRGQAGSREGDSPLSWAWTAVPGSSLAGAARCGHSKAAPCPFPFAEAHNRMHPHNKMTDYS